MFNNWTKKAILAVWVMIFSIMSAADINAKAEVFSGEGTQVQLSEEQSAAPIIEFDTQYYIAKEEDHFSSYIIGYVKINIEKDGYIRFWTDDCWMNGIFDSNMNEIYHHDNRSKHYQYSERVNAGRSYYISMGTESFSGGRFIIDFLEDKAGNTESDSEQIETNTIYKETIAVEEDRDCYKVTADVTGDAMIIYSSNVNVHMSYLNSGIDVKSDPIYGDTDTYIGKYLEVKKGDTYILDIGTDDYEVEYDFIFLTAQVESIQFTPENVSLNVQEKYQLQPVIMPELVVDGRIKYESSNTKVATVDDDGQIFAKSAGKAVIFCKAIGSGVEGVFNLIVVNPIKDETAVMNALTNMGNGMIKINLEKCSYATGYKVEYSTSKSMKNAKSVMFSGTGKNFNNLKKGKTYYFRARAFAIDGNGKRIYSKYSKIKSVKVSKR